MSGRKAVRDCPLQNFVYFVVRWVNPDRALVNRSRSCGSCSSESFSRFFVLQRRGELHWC
ncbi:unnamed protein product [Bodo saltans]|uniref:Uncharacterized protein n=1 Tax=Bodo saltans TaxID=75058 RepID=A0A0S4KH18_BODSA|nr:unnamed protein product [Bodo saltans]|eukprot:CUI14984.1 unnamed protein product [Bodo saltans]